METKISALSLKHYKASSFNGDFVNSLKRFGAYMKDEGTEEIWLDNMLLAETLCLELKLDELLTLLTSSDLFGCCGCDGIETASYLRDVYLPGLRYWHVDHDGAYETMLAFLANAPEIVAAEKERRELAKSLAVSDERSSGRGRRRV